MTDTRSEIPQPGARVSAVDPAVLKTQYCRTSTCGKRIELRDYADRHLPARWYDAGTDHPHTCRAVREAMARKA